MIETPIVIKNVSETPYLQEYIPEEYVPVIIGTGIGWVIGAISNLDYRGQIFAAIIGGGLVYLFTKQ